LYKNIPRGIHIIRDETIIRANIMPKRSPSVLPQNKT
jgi:hypothetical protein